MNNIYECLGTGNQLQDEPNHQKEIHVNETSKSALSVFLKYKRKMDIQWIPLYICLFDFI